MTKAAELAKMGEVLTNSQIGGRRNIVINGAMQVAQRGTSQTGITATANEGYTTVDRFAFDGSTHSGVFTATQSTDAPTGFSNSLKMECTTADTSTAAGELQMLQTRFEGQDLQHLKKGTSDAEKITVSFYVKGNASATYMCELQDSDNGRTNGQTFAVTTSWNRIVLTFIGDTTGTLDNDNALSFRLNFWFNAGSTFTGGTFTSNQWTTTTNERVGSITNFFDSTDRTFFITGIQLEVGSQATPFEHRSFGEELALCQRYFQKIIASSSEQSLTLSSGGQAFGASSAYVFNDLPVTMRAKPSISNSISALGNFGSFAADGGGMAISAVAIITSRSNVDRVTASLTVASGSFTAGQSVQLDGGNLDGSFIAFDSEL